MGTINKQTQIIVFVTFLLAHFYSFGQSVILAWDVQGRNQASVTTTDGRDGVTASGLEPSVIRRGPGLTLPVDPRLFAIFAATGFTEERQTAFKENDYFELEIAPERGNLVSLSRLLAKFRRNEQGPRQFLWQYKLSEDCVFYDIGNVITFNEEGDDNFDVFNLQTPIDLSTINRLQNIAFPERVTIRLYGWGADTTGGPIDTFGFGRNPRNINDLIFEGQVSSSTTPANTALAPTVWDGRTWSNGAPTVNAEPVRPVILNADYNTTNGNIKTCNLTINNNVTLTVSNQTFVEVINNVIVNGSVIVASQGNFVQVNNTGTFNVSPTGSAVVKKESAIKRDWFNYSYWSSPVKNKTVAEAFRNVDSNRRFLFNAASYLDLDEDGIDDNADDWTVVSPNDILQPGVGYIATSPKTNDFPRRDLIDFSGEFNTGTITTNIFSDPNNTIATWNLIGNPILVL